MSSERNWFYPPPPPLLSSPQQLLMHVHRPYVHETLADFLGAHESLECKLGDLCVVLLSFFFLGHSFSLVLVLKLAYEQAEARHYYLDEDELILPIYPAASQRSLYAPSTKLSPSRYIHILPTVYLFLTFDNFKD
jgi:hypothetical protein